VTLATLLSHEFQEVTSWLSLENRVRSKFAFRIEKARRLYSRTAQGIGEEEEGDGIEHIVNSCWWSFGTKPQSLTVSEILNGERDAVVDMTLNDL